MSSTSGNRPSIVFRRSLAGFEWCSADYEEKNIIVKTYE